MITVAFHRRGRRLVSQVYIHVHVNMCHFIFIRYCRGYRLLIISYVALLYGLNQRLWRQPLLCIKYPMIHVAMYFIIINLLGTKG